MLVVQKLLSLIIFAALLLVFLLPFVKSSSQDHIKPVSNHSALKNNIHKLSPRLSSEAAVHGFLLWASMGFLMPIGILIIRMSNGEECGRRRRVISYIHVTLQTSCLLMATAGAVRSIKNFDNTFNNNHQRMGLALYGAIWLQAFIGFLRPKRGSKTRSIWFSAHWVLGTAVSLLGIINIYTGLHAYHKKTSTSVWLWNVIFTVQICIIAFLYLLQDKWDYIQKQGVILGHNDQQISQRDQVKKEMPTASC